MIPSEKFQSLKGKGKLQAYTLAHEGTSTPRVIGQGTKALKWSRKVIQSIGDTIKKGVKFFVGHGSTNSHDGRQEVGEIVGSALKEIGGKLANVIVGFFPKDINVDKMDVVSMEANIEMGIDGEVSAVNNISGVAMGSSETDSPAFPGAVKLAAIQCFGQEMEQKKTSPGEGENKMTFEEVKRAVRDMNIFPHQLYKEEEMMKDNVYRKVFDERQALKADNERLAKESEDFKKLNEEALNKVKRIDAEKLLQQKLKDGFTEKQKTFIKANFDKKIDGLEDLSENGVDSFIGSSKKEFSEMAELFGVANDSPTGEQPGEGGNSGDTIDPVQRLLGKEG